MAEQPCWITKGCTGNNRLFTDDKTLGDENDAVSRDFVVSCHILKETGGRGRDLCWRPLLSLLKRLLTLKVTTGSSLRASLPKCQQDLIDLIDCPNLRVEKFTPQKLAQLQHSHSFVIRRSRRRREEVMEGVDVLEVVRCLQRSHRLVLKI